MAGVEPRDALPRDAVDRDARGPGAPRAELEVDRAPERVRPDGSPSQCLRRGGRRRPDRRWIRERDGGVVGELGGLDEQRSLADRCFGQTGARYLNIELALENDVV